MSTQSHAQANPGLEGIVAAETALSLVDGERGERVVAGHKLETLVQRDFALAKEAGFKTAVTTRRGVLFPAHRRYLTALPRVSLAGDYQSLTYTAVYLSGAPFALSNRFREVSAA